MSKNDEIFSNNSFLKTNPLSNNAFILYMAILVIATGILVVLGWLFDISQLTNLIPNAATMKFNTAWGFIILGGAIYLQTKELSRRWVIFAKLLAINVLALGTLSVFQDIFSINIGIDELIVVDSNSRISANPYPGRMSSATALCFILMGFFAVGVKTKNKNTLKVIQTLTHLVTLISFVAIVGYLFNVPEESKLSFLSSMAIHTSSTFFIMSIAVSLIHPLQGLTKFFVNDKVGNIIGRKIFLQISGVILLIAYLRILADRLDLVSMETGISLVAISCIIVSLFLIRRISNQLNFVDSRKNEAETSLRQVNKILDSNPDLIIISNQEGVIQLVNSQTEKVLGYKKEELVGHCIEKLVPKQVNSAHQKHRKSFFSQPFTRNMGSNRDFFIVRKDRKELPVEIALSVMDINEERWAISAIRDISERKEEESKISQLAAIVNSSPDAIISKKLDGTILSWNSGAERILGYKAQEIIGKNILCLFPPELKSEEKVIVEKLINGEILDQFESIRVRKDQSRIHVSVSLSPIRDKKGEIIGVSRILRDITQMQEANEKYRVVSERLKTATLASNIGIWEYNVVDNQLFWDESMYMLYGITPESFEGVYEAWEGSLHPDDLDFAAEELQAALRNEKDFNTEFRIIWPDESIRYIRAKAFVERDDQGNALRMLGTNWDITTQKYAELELKKSNDRNRIFIEQAPTAIAMLDKNMCYMAASQKWKEDYHLIDIDLIGRSHYEIFPEIGDEWKKIHQECLAGAINECDEAMFERADGSVQWINWVVRPWYISEGQIGGILMLTADITSLKLAEAEKRQTEIILDKTSEIARIGAWEVDLMNEKVYWSQITKEIHEVNEDYSPSLSGGINFYKKGKDRNKIQQAIQQAIEKGKPFDEELIIVTAKGNEIWVRAIGQAEFLNGECKRIFGVFQDINKMKITENALNYANEEMKAILNTGPISIIGTDLHGCIKHFNRGAETLLGYSAAEMINKNTPALIHVKEEVVKRGQELTVELGKPINGFDTFVELARRQSHETREWTYVRKDGSTFPVQLTISSMRGENGKITGYLGVATDLTELKEIEAKLRHISILESKSKELEQFAYITSHDLREPLLTIKNYVNLLFEDFQYDLDEEGEYVKNAITDAVNRMDVLIKDILDYSRLGKLKEKTVVDMNALLQEVCASLDSLISSSRAKIKIEKLPVLKGHATELGLLFQNLINNAIKFCPKETIPEIYIDAKKIKNGWQFEVRDNGIGIEGKNLEVIFQMFHRLNNRKKYGGTGIGLAQCKKIVEMHSGKIWVESTPGKSSCFYFTIIND